MSRYFISVRPLLTIAMLQKGYQCEDVENALHPGKPAWRFVLSRGLCEELQKYFSERDLNVPRIVTAFLEENPEGEELRAGE